MLLVVEEVEVAMGAVAVLFVAVGVGDGLGDGGVVLVCSGVAAIDGETLVTTRLTGTGFSFAIVGGCFGVVTVAIGVGEGIGGRLVSEIGGTETVTLAG